MKKFGSLIMGFVIMCSTASGMCVNASAAMYEPDVPVNSEAVYLYNLDTDTVIYAKNEKERKYPASLTKIMTCILALEHTEDLDSEMVEYPSYVQDELYRYQIANSTTVSLGGLVNGEVLTMRQALYALMLPSANEVAMSIADHIGGSQEAFAVMMNQRAKELGATDTNFVNPNGLFAEEHYTTAYDIACITLHAYSLDGFMDVVSTPSYESGPTNKHDNLTWSSTIQMMVQGNYYYNPYVSGVKTGSLPEAGKCFVSTASKGGFTYLLVTMGAPWYDTDGSYMEANLAFTDADNIYTWVFDNFKVKTLLSQNEMVGEIEVRFSLEQDSVQLITGERFADLVPDKVTSSDVTVKPNVPDFIEAPVRQGDYVGEGILILAGEEVGRVPLLAGQSVEASQALVLLDKVTGVLSSFWFKFVVIFVVLLILFYIFMMILRNRNRRRRKGGYRPRRRI